MAVLSTATSSGRNFCSCALTATNLTLYTAPAQNSNVTAPSATAYIKEIIITNSTSTPCTVTLIVMGAGMIASNLTINSNDTKILSGLNTCMSAGSSIIGYASATNSINVIISGCEIQ